MGTRNLTIVFMDGEYRVAQYGQWDGYPDGQGIVCLRFLRDKMDEKLFREMLSRIKYIDEDKLDKLWFNYGMNSDGSININDADRFRNAFPEFSRNTGAKILALIQNDGTTSNCLKDSIAFAANGLFCEWAYVVDFDKRTFEVYQGFNETPLNEEDRFYFLREYEDDDAEYHGVKLVKEFNLDDLPDDNTFIEAFKEEEVEQD